jgi:thiol-disulfide isomerase/thioredoxin
MMVWAVAEAKPENTTDTWTLQSGDTFEGSVACELGGWVYFTGDFLYNVPLNSLIAPDQERIRQITVSSKKDVKWADSQSPVSQALRKTVTALKEGKWEAFGYQDRLEPDFYVLYFGASWCGPCRRFVKSLKFWYEMFQDHDITNFEVIFCSSDRSKNAQKAYMLDEGMPWPALKWRSRLPRFFAKYKRDSIPGMVIIDRTGNILYDAHAGSEYRGAFTVLEEMKVLVARTNPQNPLTMRMYFDALRARKLNTMTTVERSNPSPVYLHITKKLRSMIKQTERTILMDISPMGRVINPRFKQAGDPEIDELLLNQIALWLFIPAVENGRAVKTSVEMPVVIQ